MQKRDCEYCHTLLKPELWQSSWIGEKHYKHNTCTDCGKEHCEQVSWEGSGHDRAFSSKRSIVSQLRKVV